MQYRTWDAQSPPSTKDVEKKAKDAKKKQVKQTDLLCWMKLSIWQKVGIEYRWEGPRGIGERRRGRLATGITLIVRNMATGRIRNRTVYRDLTRMP